VATDTRYLQSGRADMIFNRVSSVSPPPAADVVVIDTLDGQGPHAFPG
jgi:hypothetical protein